jgi:spore cortex biosynthesis protein YabQ
MTLSTQFLTMLAMIGMGSVFGAALDTYNRFLKRAKRKSWIVFINDILFWVAQGLFVFYILFLVNRGELRFYIFIALLCGFAAYQSLLKNIYLRALEVIIRMIISIYHFFIKLFHLLIYKPIHGLIIALISLLIFLGKSLVHLLRMIGKILLFFIKIIISPFKWVLLLLWKLLPKNIKKTVEKLYNRMAGFFVQIQNYSNKWISRFKKDKK